MSESNSCILLSRTNEEYPFEDEFGRFYLTTEHFYQASKYLNTDPDFAEHIRLASTTEQAKKLAKSADHPSSDDWDQIKDRVMEKALQHKVMKHEKLKELLLSIPSEEIIYDSQNDYWGVGENGSGENKLGKLLVGIKEQILLGNQETKPTEQVRTKKKHRKGKRGKKNIYKREDGTVEFEMNSSDSVRVCVTGEDIIIPTSALPGKAKTAAKKYQYFKKHNPETSDVVEQETNYSEQLLVLCELGYTDCEANYAALVSADGNLEMALDFLS